MEMFTTTLFAFLDFALTETSFAKRDELGHSELHFDIPFSSCYTPFPIFVAETLPHFEVHKYIDTKAG